MKMSVRKRSLFVIASIILFVACLIIGNFSTGIYRHLLIISPLLVFLKIMDMKVERKTSNKEGAIRPYFKDGIARQKPAKLSRLVQDYTEYIVSQRPTS
jgi:hypothetical protein